MSWVKGPLIACRSASSSDLDPSNLLEAVVTWSDCLQGRVPLVSSLKCLSERLGAEAVCLSRHLRAAGGKVHAVAFKAPSLERKNSAVLRSFAGCVLGHFLHRARPASVWLSTSCEDDADPALKVFHGRAAIAETAVVALALEGQWADYLEVHFSRALSIGSQERLSAFASTLSRTWIGRAPGLFSDVMLASRTHARSGLSEPILSAANPAQLSRAEFRVCMLLSRGLNITGVCSELSISPSTFKAHLRSIFAKTEVTSLAELLYLLLARSKSEAWQSEIAPTRRA